MSTEYTKEYFIAKFEAIPEELWHMYDYVSDENTDCKCALGHCGFSDFEETEEGWALIKLLPYRVPNINDDMYGNTVEGSTPKERILNALMQVHAQ